MSNIGNRIKLLRKEKNITQEEFGKKFGIVKSTVSLYESNKSTPDDSLKKEMAKYFNVSLDYLMGASDIRNPYINESLPDKLKTAEEAAQFLLKQNSVMAYGEFDINKLSDDEKIQFANELLQQLKLLAYKYKK